MAEAYIVDALRTPVGKRNGSLSAVYPADLAAHVLTALVDRTGVDPGPVDDLILGSSTRSGPRPGTSRARPGSRPVFPSRCLARPWTGSAARPSRLSTTDAGFFDEKIVGFDGLAADEGIRRNTSLEKLATLDALRLGSRLTAAVSSQISDGASALLLTPRKLSRTEKPRTAAVRNGAHEIRPSHPLHAVLDDRMMYAEEFSESGAQHHQVPGARHRADPVRRAASHPHADP